MPRGRKVAQVKTVDEQIADIDTEIEEYKQKISEAKEKRKILMEHKEKEQMVALFEAVKASGKTPEDFLKILQEKAQN